MRAFLRLYQSISDRPLPSFCYSPNSAVTSGVKPKMWRPAGCRRQAVTRDATSTSAEPMLPASRHCGRESQSCCSGRFPRRERTSTPVDASLDCLYSFPPQVMTPVWTRPACLLLGVAHGEPAPVSATSSSGKSEISRF